MVKFYESFLMSFPGAGISNKIIILIFSIHLLQFDTFYWYEKTVLASYFKIKMVQADEREVGVVLDHQIRFFFLNF